MKYALLIYAAEKEWTEKSREEQGRIYNYAGTSALLGVRPRLRSKTRALKRERQAAQALTSVLGRHLT